MTSKSIYHELQQHLDKLPIGMPSTESEIEIKLLKHLFTPEEAKIALQLNMIGETVERIFVRIKTTDITISLAELDKVLDTMATKGAIHPHIRENGIKYSLAQLAIGMFEFQVDKMTKEFAQDIIEYSQGEFAREFHKTKVPQLRTIPVNASITAEMGISIYDDIRNYINLIEGQFGVMNCICKQGKDLVGDSCKVTDIRETCLLFPEAVPLFAKFECVRYIDKNEFLEILNRAEKVGLVIQPSNTQRPSAICCCCGDCCGILSMAKQFKKPAELFSSNYFAEIISENCIGCGICLEKCQMDAPIIQEKQAYINLDRCIGCGICITSCSKEAIKLRQKNNIKTPPKSNRALYQKILTKKKGKIGTLKIGANLMLGKKI